MRKPKRIVDKKLLKAVAARPCIISGCRQTPVVACHIGTRGARRDDVPENLFPACIWHHSEQHNLGILTFAKKYPEVGEDFIAKGWDLSGYKIRRAS